MKNEEYKTSDMGIATTLLYFGFELLRLEPHQERKNKKVFVFLESKEQPLEEFIMKYWNGELEVEPIKYFRVMKEIKARLYSNVL